MPRRNDSKRRECVREGEVGKYLYGGEFIGHSLFFITISKNRCVLKNDIRIVVLEYVTKKGIETPFVCETYLLSPSALIKDLDI